MDGIQLKQQVTIAVESLIPRIGEMY